MCAHVNTVSLNQGCKKNTCLFRAIIDIFSNFWDVKDRTLGGLAEEKNKFLAKDPNDNDFEFYQINCN